MHCLDQSNFEAELSVIYTYICVYMLVPIGEILPYSYRNHHTGMGPHTRMVIYFAPCAYSHENLVVEA